MKKVVDGITVVYNAKVAEEKKKDGGNKKKGKEKPKIAAGKALDNSRNNNPQMVADLLGGEDDYGDEYGDYGDYGDESGTGSKKVAENQYDFMWVVNKHNLEWLTSMQAILPLFTCFRSKQGRDSLSSAIFSIVVSALQSAL